MSKSVIITGHRGYIGRHLIKMMQNDYNIVALIDIEDLYQSLDIRKKLPVYPAVDTVIHLAAQVNVGHSVSHPALYYTTNVNGTLNLLNKLTYKHFIFASTGAAEVMSSPYAISKRMAEDCIQEHCVHRRSDYTIFRFYNVVGTDGIPATNQDGLFNKLIEAKKTGVFYLYGSEYDTPDGTAVRDYLHVNEVCASLIQAIDRPANGLECLGHGQGYSVRQIAEIFQQVNDCRFDIVCCAARPGDAAQTVLQKVSSYLTPRYSIEQMFKI